MEQKCKFCEKNYNMESSVLSFLNNFFGMNGKIKGYCPNCKNYEIDDSAIYIIKSIKNKYGTEDINNPHYKNRINSLIAVGDISTGVSAKFIYLEKSGKYIFTTPVERVSYSKNGIIVFTQNSVYFLKKA